MEYSKARSGGTQVYLACPKDFHYFLANTWCLVADFEQLRNETGLVRASLSPSRFRRANRCVFLTLSILTRVIPVHYITSTLFMQLRLQQQTFHSLLLYCLSSKIKSRLKQSFTANCLLWSVLEGGSRDTHACDYSHVTLFFFSKPNRSTQVGNTLPHEFKRFLGSFVHVLEACMRFFNFFVDFFYCNSTKETR